jgi:hypothetical protein
MKALPLSLQDKALLKARNMADNIKEFSSLNQHRSVINAFVHTSSRLLPPTRSTRSSPSATFSPAISSKTQPEKPLIRVNYIRATPLPSDWNRSEEAAVPKPKRPRKG